MTTDALHQLNSTVDTLLDQLRQLRKENLTLQHTLSEQRTAHALLKEKQQHATKRLEALIVTLEEKIRGE